MFRYYIVIGISCMMINDQFNHEMTRVIVCEKWILILLLLIFMIVLDFNFQMTYIFFKFPYSILQISMKFLTISAVTLLLSFFSPSQALKCEQGQILNQNQMCIEPQYIEGCIQYKSKNQCDACAQGFHLNNRRCDYILGAQVQAPLLGCLQRNNKDECINCANGFIRENGQCKVGVKNCLRYQEEKCAECKPNFSLIVGECKHNILLGCKKQNKDHTCSECWKPFRLNGDHCDIDNCMSLNDYGCTTCDCGFYLTTDRQCKQIENGCMRYERSRCTDCLPHYKLKGGICEIQGCIKYGENLCSECKNNYELVDGNCQFQNCYDWAHDQCLICKEGYKVSEGVCINQDVPQNKVIKLDNNNKNVDYKTKLNLPSNSYYSLTFKYAARQGRPLNTSDFIVKINGESVKVEPENHEINEYSIVFKGMEGENILNLIGSGAEDGQGVTIDNVQVISIGSSEDCLGMQNFVVNGDFQKFDLKGKKQRLTEDIQGWNVKDGEVGFGYLYSKHWSPQTKVIELDGKKHADYEAQVDLPLNGMYQLNFDYAAHKGKSIDTSAFVVNINGQSVKIIPQDHQMKHYKAIFRGIKGHNILALIGSGQSDSFGVTIDNVSITGISPDCVGQQNFVLNGDFENFNLNDEKWRSTDDLPGWEVENGEVGEGQLYNRHWAAYMCQ